MKSDLTLVSINNYELKLNHILIILVLSLSFSISFFLRSLPADFAWELHEFDPFFNYRATEYLVNNGLEKYFEWHDDLSWYPIGRDISRDAQIMLHITAASTYSIFANSINLYDFTIIFPVVFGSLTCIPLFALVRKLSNTTSGLLAALLFSISLPIIIRGQIGWFKSEPLGLFFGILASYLFLKALSEKNLRYSIIISLLSGIFLILGLSSWGGVFFFILPMGILILTLPFVRKDHKFILLTISTFSSSLFFFSLFFERLSSGIATGIDGLPIIFSSITMTTIIFVQKMSSTKNKLRNSVIVIVFLILVISTLLIFNDSLNLFSLPTHRYLNALIPTLTSSNPLTDSVSEHSTLNIFQSFQLHSVLLLFSGIGVWLIIQNKKNHYLSNQMLIYSLTFGFLGAYIGSAFMRLEVFTSLGLIILSSIGIKLLINLKNPNKNKLKFSKYLLISSVFIILMIPFFLPSQGNILKITSSVTPTISNGGTNFLVSTNDWRESLEWIKNNTPENSVIASWWDYGYWIQTIANRASIADNSTLIDHRISTIAKIFFESPDDAWKSLNELEADYFIIFISGENTNLLTKDGQSIFLLNGGGDESKKFWFTKIADIQISKYLESDQVSGTPLFWDETFLGKITPFKLLGYVDVNSDQISESYISGWLPIYIKENKFTNENDPFHLVYSSSSYETQIDNKMIGVFVYQINQKYVPISTEWDSPVVPWK